MTNHIGIVFPGQGSQSVGMLSDIATQFDEVKQTFSEASSVLGYDLWALTSEGPAEKLDTTTYTQPALLTASYALYKILTSRTDIKPALLAGHSLGEYTALVCANAIAFSDAVKLVAARGQFMQDAVAPKVGAMAAIIGLDNADVESICNDVRHETKQILSPANFNSIGQVVIAGHAAAVEKAMLIAKEKGAKMAVLIPVSVPSHCELMREAAERLSELIKTIEIKSPTMTVINNVDVNAYTDANSIRTGLVRQLSMPVRWVDTIQYFVTNDVTNIIECGPGKVLSGLNKRINKSLNLSNTADLSALDALLKFSNERSL